MSDVVWLIDSNPGDVGELVVRTRTVAAALFDPDGVVWAVEAAEGICDTPLSSEARRHIYLIVKEALTNARRHASARAVGVRFSGGRAGLSVEIYDNGLGIRETPDGNGIRNMCKRAYDLGGILNIVREEPGGVTRVTLQTGAPNRWALSASTLGSTTGRRDVLSWANILRRRRSRSGL